MEFTLLHTDNGSSARAGLIKTDHGSIETPIFMPVGTLGSVKGVQVRDLEDEVKAQIILGNTYHLYLRPGMDVLTRAGGLHKFNAWNGPILSDSGGYQVYSLAESRKITEKGVRFRSHIDGSLHEFTPEHAVDVQRQIGADFIMAFDECPPANAEYKYVLESMHLTHRWLKRCTDRFDSTDSHYGHEQTLMPIVQGGVFPELRKQSAEFIAELGRPANAIGGLSVGEPEEELYAMTELTTGILPKDKPRYLMGVGTPANLLECVSLGVDMFDCVMPSRNARNGMLFTMKGIINIKNEKWKMDFSPIDSEGEARVDSEYSKAYVRHLIISNERLGAQIATIHNLAFYLRLMREARERILENTFDQWKRKLIPVLKSRL